MSSTVADPAIAIAADKLVIPFEGFRAAPYQDSTGKWTIGYGTTVQANGRVVGPDTPLVTPSYARLCVENDLKWALEIVDEFVTVPTNPNQTAALLDFVYNLGSGNFEKSTLLRLLNQADYAGAADQFCRWDEAGGEVLPGLLRRRQAERSLFMEPWNGPA